jgi:DNA polymerase III alpha subunit (gram-positive type)
MNIQTKYEIGQKLFLIENDKIQSFKVNKIEAKTYNITSCCIIYSFITSKGLTLMDKDHIIYRSEDECFPSIEDLTKSYTHE